MFVSLLIAFSVPYDAAAETGNPLEPIDYRDPILFDLPVPHSHRAPSKEALDWINSSLRNVGDRLAKEPNEVFLLIDKAHLLQCQGNLKEAISQCEMANKWKKTGFGLYRHASIEFDLGHWQRTVDDTNEALELLPDNKEILALRLAANTKLNKNTEAMRDELIILQLLKDDVLKRKQAVIDLIALAKKNAGRARFGWGSFMETEVNSYFFKTSYWTRRKSAGSGK